jgi:hypothetical protein
MTDLDRGRDPFESVVSDTLRARAATNVLPPDGLDQIRLEVARRRRRRRTTWLAAAALFVVFLGVAALVAARSPGDDSAPFVGPDVTSGEGVVEPPEVTLATPPAADRDAPPSDPCATSPGGWTSPISGDIGVESVAELVSVAWREVAGDLPLRSFSESSFPCSITVVTPAGDFTASGYQGPEGLWYLSYVWPTDVPDGDDHLSVQWLLDGSIQVFSNATCAGCVSSEVTALAAGRSWIGGSGVPLAVEMQAPGSNGNRALLIRYLDADGAVRSVRFISIRDGDFAAG